MTMSFIRMLQVSCQLHSSKLVHFAPFWCICASFGACAGNAGSLRHAAICAAMLLAIGNAAMHASLLFICRHIRQGDIPVDKL